MEALSGNLPEHPGPKPAERGQARLLQPERRQMELRAMMLDDLIARDHLVRLVWDLVQRFDLRPLLDPIKARTGTAGHPQTDPKLLVALWLYATLDGRRWTEWAARASWRGCVSSIMPIAGCAAG